MKVGVKSFHVRMDVKNKGIEFDVYDRNDTHLGDCIITKSGIIWCDGRTQRKNGKKIPWAELIAWANRHD